MRTLKFVIHRKTESHGEDGILVAQEYFWATIVASNGRILFTSEMYTAKPSARRAINALYDPKNPHHKIVDTTIKNNSHAKANKSRAAKGA